jgi:5-methylcytosine-specific restriction endonuclease McrA
MSGYGIFWSIVEDLYNNSNQLMIDYEGIAYDLRSDIDTIKSIINDFDLFMIVDDMFGSKSIENRIQERSEKSSKARTSALSKWGSNTNQAKRSERLTEARKKATHTKDEWEAMRLFFGECVKCGNKEDLVKDHITPIYQGGSDGLENLQPLCRKCNASKGADSTDYRSIYCDKNDCEMPTTYFKTPTIKERKEIKGKEIKGKEKKIKYKDNVLLTENENEKLVSEFGKDTIEKAYDFLSSYKIEKSYSTKSDYLTIRRWVLDAIKKPNKTVSQQNNNNPYQQQLEAARMAYKPISE